MMNTKSLIAALVIVSLFFHSCEKDEPVIVDPPEVITTLTYTLTPNDGGDTVELSFKDLDGDGGNAPEIVGGTLTTNTTYVGALGLLNEQESPAGDIGAEVSEEDEEHQFFFQTSIAGMDISYTDEDADGNPVGLNTELTTTDAGNGTITIILRHEPSKGATGVSDGDITNAGGETDIEVTFNVDVQ